MRDARRRFAAGDASADELARAEDQAIAAAVNLQERVGLKLVTDGEFRRGSWHMDFLHRIGGVATTGQLLRIQFRKSSVSRAELIDSLRNLIEMLEHDEDSSSGHNQANPAVA